jgi:chromosome segregation ATPase
MCTVKDLELFHLANPHNEFPFFRETIMRLVAEVGDEKKQLEKQQHIIGDLTLEKDTLQQKVRELEVDLENARNKMKTSQEAWALTRDNLHEREERLAEYKSVQIQNCG